jgi:hypothetical protein
MNLKNRSLLLFCLFGVPLLGVSLNAQDGQGKKKEKPMLECRVIVKEKTSVGYPYEVALLEVEPKNVSEKAIDMRCRSRLACVGRSASPRRSA